MKNKMRLRFFVGVLLLFAFTQIQWAKLFFPTKQLRDVEIDNTALFYTESEAAVKAAFYLKKK